MGRLFNLIRQLVAGNRYVIGLHASERLDERGIMEWQAVVGLADGELIADRDQASPHPAIEVRQIQLDGTAYKAV